MVLAAKPSDSLTLLTNLPNCLVSRFADAPLAHHRQAFEAQKAEWEAKNPDTPYPHSCPEADTHHGTAARKYTCPTYLIILIFSRPRIVRNPPLPEGRGTTCPKNPVPALGLGNNHFPLSPWARDSFSVHGNRGPTRGHGSVPSFLF